MNVAGLRARVLNRTGTGQADLGLPVSLVNDYINEANRQIGNQHDWPWRFADTSFVTVANTGEYVLPTDHLRTRTLKIAGQAPFRQRTTFDLESVWPDDTWTAQPYEYAIEGTNLLIRPVPDAVYTVLHRYLTLEPALTQDTDSPLMPEMFQTAIVEYATYLSFRKLGNYQASAVAKAEYDAELFSMNDKVRKTRQAIGIAVRPGAWENV